MSAKILYGKDIRKSIFEELAPKIVDLKKSDIVPGLATVLVGEDSASKVYVANKIKACKENGLASFNFNLPENTQETDLIGKIRELNEDKKVHGILVQLPLPEHINYYNVIGKICPSKDVDGLHPVSQGKLMRCKKKSEIDNSDLFVSCTPSGIMEMLLRNNIKVSGKNAVIIGRSTLVGKPLAMLLMASDATVTVCHSKTADLKAKCSQADILIAAAGRPKIVKSDMVKEGAVVVDVGINRVEGKIMGDVDFEEVRKRASAITPVPGGVGLLTVAMLISNTVKAAENTATLMGTD